MKIALLMTDGVEQIVFTPEDKGERQLLERLTGEKEIKIHQTAFYETVANYYRHDKNHDEKSTIIVLRTPAAKGIERVEIVPLPPQTKEQKAGDYHTLMRCNVDPRAITKPELIHNLARLIKQIERN